MRLAIRTTGLKSAQLTRAYRLKLTTAGGAEPVAWKVVRGKLPPGVALSKAGTIAGTPRSTGRFAVTFEARDALGAKSRKSLILVVNT